MVEMRCGNGFGGRRSIEMGMMAGVLLTLAIFVYMFWPEKNPFVDEMTKKFGVPRDAAVGKPETLYPEYRKKMAASGTSR